LAEYWYNTCYHSALQHTPFEILYAHAPRHFGIDPNQDVLVPDLADWFKHRHAIQALLQQQLMRAQQRMKSQADKHRTERSFSVGEFVWLKLQPYAQASVATRVSKKLSYRYFGPYEIEEKIGTVAYRLKIPDYSTVHPVFHVSLLKKVTGTVTPSISPLPQDIPDLQIPEQVLDERMTSRSNCLLRQLLIKWRHVPPTLATWEDEDEIIRLYPDFTVWGEAVSKDGGDVTVARPVPVNTKSSRAKRSRKPNTRVTSPEWRK